MPLDLVSEELSKETVEALQAHLQYIKRPVLISPIRMKALRDAMAMRMTMTINGVPVQLWEHAEAPGSMSECLAAACAPDPESKFVFCSSCGGEVAQAKSGRLVCIECLAIQQGAAGPTPASQPQQPPSGASQPQQPPSGAAQRDYSHIKLASERASNGRG